MRTIFHLIRHAAHDRVGTVLVGRLNGVHLSLAGRAQAKELAHHFAREEIAAVISSPRERHWPTIRSTFGSDCPQVRQMTRKRGRPSGWKNCGSL